MTEEFTRSVYVATSTIPRGKVATYGAIAKAIGRPKAARAVGQALGANPQPIVVPCHRVVRSDGTLGGYSGTGGVRTKARLLDREGVSIKAGRIDLGRFMFSDFE